MPGAGRAGGPGAAPAGGRAGGPGAVPGGGRAGGPAAPGGGRAGGAGRGGAGGGFGGGFGGFGGGGGNQQPVVLSRNGREFTITGEITVPANTEFKVNTERESVNLSISQLDVGNWVMFELPGFTTAAAGTEQKSLDALRNARETSYFKSDGSLWVKLVVANETVGGFNNFGGGGAASVQVSR